MDCCLRGRPDLAYACIDGYLDAGGDYTGTQLLPFYARYRSMVRAKVAALAVEQEITGAERKLDAHLAWVERQCQRGPETLLVTCGLSGSGKSYWARQLVPELNAIRLRSDIYRKQRAGLAPGAQSDSAVGAGLYASDNSDATYSELAELCERLLAEGESVIVDAACLQEHQRQRCFQRAGG